MKRIHLMWLVGAVAVAAALRFYALGAQSLWVDETGTLLNACFPQESIAHFAFHDSNSPPLYFWCVALLTRLFGPTEFGARFLSALCGTLSVPLLYFLVRRLQNNGMFSREKSQGGAREERRLRTEDGGRKAGQTSNIQHSGFNVQRGGSRCAGNSLSRSLFGFIRVDLGSKNAALWSAGLLAVNPLHLWFSQEARCYSFLLCLTLAGLLLFLRAAQSMRRRDWLGFAAVSAAAVSTHLLGIVLLLICWAWWFSQRNLWGRWTRFSVARASCPRRASLSFVVWKPLTAVSAAVGLLWIALVVYIRQVCHTVPPPRAFSGMEIPYTFYAFVGGFSFGPPLRELQLAGASALVRHGPQALLVFLVLAAVGVGMLCGGVAAAKQILSPRAAYDSEGRRSGFCGAAAFTMLWVPIAFSVAVSLVSSHPYNVRFVLTSLAGFLILSALLLQSLSRRLRWGLGFLLVGVSLWADVQWFAVPAFGKDDLRAAVQAVYAVRPDAKKLLVAPVYMEDSVYYYLFRQNRSAQVVSVAGEQAVEKHADADALFVMRTHHISDPPGLVAAFKKANPDRSVECLKFPGIEVYVAGERAARILEPVPARDKFGWFPGDPAGRGNKGFYNRYR